MAGGWKLKFAFCFMETAHEPLHLDKWSLVQWKITDMPTSFIWIVVSFLEAFKYGDGAKFWSYVRTDAEPLCVELWFFAMP
jgi:hypothetical protein